MKYYLIFILLICLSFPYQAEAIDAHAKQKYPYILLTDDYGILNENDLASFTWGVAPYKPFVPSFKEIYAMNYWQCFKREEVTIRLDDMGYPSEDVDPEDTYGNLSIIVNANDCTHRYGMRRAWPVNNYLKEFNHWHKLLKNQKYVCIAGTFANFEEKIVNGEKHKFYQWQFDRIKTKKGCDSYFKGDCTQTYAQYKKQQEDADKLLKLGG